MNPFPPSTAASADIVTVAIMGTGTPAAPALHETLARTAPRPGSAGYRVIDVNSAGRPVHADIVVCAHARMAAVAAMVWPDADVVVLISLRDGDTDVLEALEAGATVCVRGSDVGLVAAYVHAVGRRREHTRTDQTRKEQVLGGAS